MRESILNDLAKCGQSIWLDNINRTMIESGKLKSLIDIGLRGMTSNPAIFDRSIRLSKDYDNKIDLLSKAGKHALEIYDDLTVEDVQDAADLFKEVYIDTDCLDGYVSLEVNPQHAFDAKKTIEDALRLHEKVGKANVMLKIPATKQGFIAIEELTGRGVNINATLIFSREQYINTANSFIKGLKRLYDNFGDISKVHSVASVFVSRVDTMIDRIIDKKIKDGEKHIINYLKGKAAVSNARLIYKKYQEIFEGDGFKGLKEKGGNVQRVLWASTSTKNPDYSDIKYVVELIGRGTVNTLPDEALNAFMDHGAAREVLPGTALEDYDVINSLRIADIDIDAVCNMLLDDGIMAFEKAFSALLGSIESKAGSLCKK